MPAGIGPIIKQRVIAHYLQGVSRDRIATDNGIGTGTVSNIIDEQNGLYPYILGETQSINDS
ncbi:MAG: helix-turn-helix domain-containing protein [Candidatus Nitrosopolaris sp.]